MKEPSISIRLEGNGRVYEPGETLAGIYWLHATAPNEVRAIEVSVLWHTEGKGDEDFSVHEFRRLAADEGCPIDPREPGRFSTVLPASPLSYDGEIVKVRWCVRVRAFLTRGRNVLGEMRFKLGSAPAPKAAVR